MWCPFLWANEIRRVVSKKILSRFGAVWWSAVLHEDEIIVWIQTPAFWQQGRLQKVNVSLLVDLSFWGSMKKICFSIPRHTCTNHQLFQKLISVMIQCLQTLFYDVQHYFACITARKRFRWKFIDIFEDVYSLHTCLSFHLLCFISHNAMRKFRAFFRATRYMASWPLASFAAILWFYVERDICVVFSK